MPKPQSIWDAPAGRIRAAGGWPMWRAAFRAALFWILFTSPGLAETRIALVVGNSGYQYVSPLPNPANDARLLAETLTRLGFRLVGGGGQLDLDKAHFDL